MQAVWAKVFRDAVFPAASLNTFFGQLHASCSAQSVQGRCLPNTVPEHLHCPNSKSVQGRCLSTSIPEHFVQAKWQNCSGLASHILNPEQWQ